MEIVLDFKNDLVPRRWREIEMQKISASIMIDDFRKAQSRNIFMSIHENLGRISIVVINDDFQKKARTVKAC